MKFAKYLKDHQIVEWNKEYIDYRGLKKIIAASRDAQDGLPQVRNDDGYDYSHGRPVHPKPKGKYGSMGYTPPYSSHIPEFSSPHDRVPPIHMPDAALELPVASAHTSDRAPKREHPVPMSIVYSIPESQDAESSLRPRMIKSKTEPPSKLAATGLSPSSASSRSFLSGLRRRQEDKKLRPSPSFPENMTLADCMAKLTPLEQRYIMQLDKELAKVNRFYLKLEKDAMLREEDLVRQFHALENHEILFKEHRRTEAKWTSYFGHRTLNNVFPSWFNTPSSKGKETVGRVNGKDNNWHVENADASQSNSSIGRTTGPNGISSRMRVSERDPEEYRVTRKILKNALREYHRFLELILEFRALNIAGFTKALKKFDKATRRGISDKYMRERVDVSEFSRNQDTIQNMKNHWASQFAKYFTNGDEKKARARLRPPITSNSHHMSVFRTGVYIGVCLPALVDGLFESFKADTRQRIPWDSLLFVYAAFAIPPVFVLLVGINVLIWYKARINYILIFDLVHRRKLDGQQFFELPAFLLSALVCSFWLSFRRVGEGVIAPTTWPLIWLGLTLAVLFNPLPIAFSSSRWWMLKKIGKLLVSGTKPVDFTDFWLGDQFCSLIFTLSNFYFVVCVYEQKWEDPWSNCSASKHWGIPFALASIPLIIRALQCVKRFSDVRKQTEGKSQANKPFVVKYRDLINAGKYTTSIIYYALYYSWRHHNLAHDYSFVIFIMAATCYSIYTCSWDILIDWSLLKHDREHLFLREDMLYSQKSVYYFAIISNVILRFVWIIYIPGGNFNMNIRSFIAGTLEMFRRWQWNFFRLEAEQLGNIDMYAAVRDIRLPYDATIADDDDDDYDDYELSNRSNEAAGWKSKIRGSRRSSKGKFDDDNTSQHS